jgi:hypothetical protein
MPRRRALAGSVLALAVAAVAACSSASGKPVGAAGATPGPTTSVNPTPSPTPTPKPTPTIPPPQGAPGAWVTAVERNGRPEIQTQTIAAGGSTVVVMRTDAPTTKLVLHAGYEDPGGTGWPNGPAISDAEKATLLAAFNGGFRLNLGLGGFEAAGRVGAAISPGFATVVTYADGTSAIGTWGTEVPNPYKKVVSVRQNLTMLVDNGQPAANIDEYSPWGATLGGGFAVARSGLGIDKYGNLLWAGSSYATPRAIATALIQSGAVRAMQLDINPMWVTGFTFPNAYSQVVVLPGQYNPIGTYLNPYGRDYFTVALKTKAAT